MLFFKKFFLILIFIIFITLKAYADVSAEKKFSVILDANAFIEEKSTLNYINVNSEYVKNPFRFFLSVREKVVETSFDQTIISQFFGSYYHKKKCLEEIKIGKQRFRVGRGLVWNTVNIIDLPGLLSPGYFSEGKWGISVSLRLYPNLSSEFATYFSNDNSKVLFLNRYDLQLFSFDLTFLGSTDKEDKFHFGFDAVKVITPNIYFHSNADTIGILKKFEWRSEQGIRVMLPHENLSMIFAYLNNSEKYRLTESGRERIRNWLGEYLGLGISKYNVPFLKKTIEVDSLFTINLKDRTYLSNLGANWLNKNFSFNPQYFFSKDEKIVKIIIGYYW